jgi:hypothetical protein
VRWVDPNDFGGDDLQAGEVLAIDGDVITPSEFVEWRLYTEGRIVFYGADGGPLGAPVICYPDDAGGIRLASVPAGIFLADADRQCGSRFAFAVGLTSAEIEAAGLYTVAEMRPSADGTASIALAQYDARIYAGDQIGVDPEDYTASWGGLPDSEADTVDWGGAPDTDYTGIDIEFGGFP